MAWKASCCALRWKHKTSWKPPFLTHRRWEKSKNISQKTIPTQTKMRLPRRSATTRRTAYLGFVDLHSLSILFPYTQKTANIGHVPPSADVAPICSRLRPRFCANKKFCHAWNCESIFFCCFSLCGVFLRGGGSAQGDVVLPIRSWLLVFPFAIRRRLVSPSWTALRLLETCPAQVGMHGSELRRLLITLVSLAHFGAPLGQRKPRRFVTFNPCKPCPHMVFCSSVCRSTAPPPSRLKRRAKKKNHSLTLLLSFVGAQEKFAEIFSRRLLGARSPFLRCGNRLKRRPTCVLPLNEL